MNTKKNILRTLSAFVIGLSLLAQSAKVLASARQVVRIDNNASQSILGVYASNTLDGRWGPDRLGTQVINPGRSMALDLDDGSGSCLADLKMVLRNGQEMIRYNVNICDTISWHIDDRYDSFVVV